MNLTELKKRLEVVGMRTNLIGQSYEVNIKEDSFNNDLLQVVYLFSVNKGELKSFKYLNGKLFSVNGEVYVFEIGRMKELFIKEEEAKK